MKVIINRGFDRCTAKPIIFINGNKYVFTNTCDIIECDTKAGDIINVKLMSLDATTVSIGKFICSGELSICHIGPSVFCKIWELVNYKILPYFSIIFLVLKSAIHSTNYNWFCTSMVVLTALSLFCFKMCMLIPCIRKNFYKLELF
mgnify:FL=1